MCSPWCDWIGEDFRNGQGHRDAATSDIDSFAQQDLGKTDLARDVGTFPRKLG